MSVLLPTLIVVVGWIATHILTLRAQRNNLRNQIVDHARLEVVDGLRDYQEWLQQRMALISSIQVDAQLGRELVAIDWFERSRQVGEALKPSDTTYRWQFRLEEYEVIFPEAKAAAGAIGLRQQALLRRLSDLQHKLGIVAMVSVNMRADSSEVNAIANASIIAISDQIALTEDLRIWLQNKTLGQLMGRKVPQRVPTDPALPRIVPGKRGFLVLMEGSTDKADIGESIPIESTK